jgi:D-beta-D-heptose 7-phosphate kinase/D-beta-D-heptose 1-phosphate adenosyltransferase
MVRLSGTFSRLQRSKILVAGDLFLDSYTIGKAKRISPEAPVAVIHVEKEEHRAGGAGNVILNLISLNTEVVALGRVGSDLHGDVLKNSLVKEHVDVKGIVTQANYFTPVKNRIIADNQQIVRVDHEAIIALPEQLEQQIIDELPSLLKDVQIVAISDYGKGFLTRSLLAALIEEAQKLNIPVVTDPKGIDFTKYAGSTIIKPNLGEAYAAANLPSDTSIDKVADKILKEANMDVLIVTRSESGISVFEKNGTRQDFPVKIREVKDVTGAGDTVLATLACALANKLDLKEAVQLSNVAAGIAIEHIGCARVTLPELAKRLLEYDVVNKVFDGDHIYALQQALRNQRFKVLHVSNAEGFTTEIYKEIKQSSQNSNEKLIVYIKEDEPSDSFIDILASLREVDYIIVCNKSLAQLSQEITI